MRKQRITAAALALALLYAAALPARAEEGPITESAAVLAEGAVLRERVWWNGTDYVREHYIELAPPEAAGLRPVVMSGDVLTDTAPLDEMAAELEERGLRVAAGLNGGFYTLSSGIPVGLVVRDGLLRSDDDGLTGLGFTSEGEAFIGGSFVWMSLETGTDLVGVQTLNHSRGVGLALFTGEFGTRTAATGAGWNIICDYAPDPETGEASPGGIPVSGDTALTVREVLPETGRIPIPEGCVVLSLAWDMEQPAPDWLAALAPGAPLTLHVTCAEGWEGVDSALCLLYPLLENGEVAGGLEKLRDPAPRSAVGLREDGSMVLYTVDGRQSGYSAGLGLDAVAERLRDLGCVTAGALDGGASTQMRAMLPGDAELSQIGRPSGLRTRSVANYIFLVSESHAPEDAARLALYPLDIDAVAGAEIPLAVKAVDAFLNPAPAPEAPEFAVSRDLGTVKGGVFRAGKAGEGAITVSAPGLAGASAALRVVESPEELLLYGEVYGRHTKSLTLEPGQEVDLTVRAFDNHVRLISQDENFLWELDEAAGTVDETGHLTPAMASGKGILRVRAGETVTEIPITIWSGVPFGDVPVTHPSFDAIRYVYEHSLFNGTGETEFSPEAEMNRAMLVTVLWRMLGEPEAETVPGFWDVDPAEWYGPAVAWGVERGILTGYSETLFGPMDPITGEQLFTILHRLSAAVTETVEGEATEEPPEEVSEEPPENIPDELPNEPELPETSPWARDAVAWTLRPEYRLTDAEDLSALRDSATRAGVAEALFRYLTRAAAEAEERAETP